MKRDLLDETHNPSRKSFVETANLLDTDFPIQNLPFGVFSTATDRTRRIGVAIGDRVFALNKAVGLMERLASPARDALQESSLDTLFGLGRCTVRVVRQMVADLLDERATGNRARSHAGELLVPMQDCIMHLPTTVSNFTDFYAGIYHARAAGALLTPEDPLPQNYKWVPIAYHGRASSVRVGQGTVRRPLGQHPPVSPGAPPTFGASERLDFELEMGFYLSNGNSLGEPIPIDVAWEKIVGFSLLNDWSARDLQRWEMFPLGPFLSKSFGTSVSPWVVTADALAPFRTAALPRPEGDPVPLPYLFDEEDQENGAIDVHLEVFLTTEKMRAAGLPADRIVTSNAKYLYWTPAQMVAHHSINGCNLESGDLIGTGTISGPSAAELSSMLEFTSAGTKPVTLSNGETRGFLRDGDEITLRGRCNLEGYTSIGFGDCTGRIEPAVGLNRLTAKDGG